jgi:hypothetical protein
MQTIYFIFNALQIFFTTLFNNLKQITEFNKVITNVKEIMYTSSGYLAKELYYKSI